MKGYSSQKIINTAKCLFLKYGYLGVSMEDLARKLKITKAALYWYFSSKKEIHKKVLEEIFKEFKTEIQSALKKSQKKAKLQEIIKVYLEFGLKEKGLIRILVSSNKETQIKSQILNFKRKTEELISNALKGIVPKHQLKFLINILNGILLEFSYLNSKYKKSNLNFISKKILELFQFDSNLK